MEDLIPVLLVIGYLVLRFIGKFAGERQEEGELERENYSVDDVLQELMGDLGTEQPVPSEHRRTRSEHRPTPSEHRATFSESQPTASEHRQTLIEIAETPSEHRPTASEHRPSWSEHLKGDVQGPPIPTGDPPTTGHIRSRFGQALVADLRGGAGRLARVIVLSDILGPPVSLRSGERS